MYVYKRTILFLIGSVALISALIGGAAGGFLVSRLGENQLQENKAGSEILESDLPDTGAGINIIQLGASDIKTSITEVVEQIGPAVVTVIGTVDVRSGMFGGTSTSEVSGSGVYLTEDGYLITNEHVVDDARDFKVILADGQELEASLVGSDVFSDLAVLKTEMPAPAVAVLGNSDLLDPGESVIAIGSPLGEFMNSVTVGVVSATHRSIDTGNGYSIEDLIQTDAAINQGNSGGPLVNLAGEVVGINNLVVRGSSGTVAEGLGFAIPSNTVEAVASQIIQTGDFLRPYLGLQWQTITPYIANRYRLPSEWGVYVTGVRANSPAEGAGIQENDIITRIGDVELDADRSFINVLFQYQPGDTVELGLIRDGKEIQIKVTAGGS